MCFDMTDPAAKGPMSKICWSVKCHTGKTNDHYITMLHKLIKLFILVLYWGMGVAWGLSLLNNSLCYKIVARNKFYNYCNIDEHLLINGIFWCSKTWNLQWVCEEIFKTQHWPTNIIQYMNCNMPPKSYQVLYTNNLYYKQEVTMYISFASSSEETWAES